MCLLCDYTGRKSCTHDSPDKSEKGILMQFANGFFLGKMDILLEQQDDNNRDKPRPGSGVTIKDILDKNHDRDGFIREYEGEHYNIFFEPGDKDGKYRRDQFDVNDQSIDPKKIPDPAK